MFDYFIDALFFPKDANGNVVENTHRLNDDFTTKDIAEIVINKLDGFYYRNNKVEGGVSDYKNIEKAKELWF